MTSDNSNADTLGILGKITPFKKKVVDDLIPKDLAGRNVASPTYDNVNAKSISDNTNPKSIRNNLSQYNGNSINKLEEESSCPISDTVVPYKPKSGDSIASTELDIKGVYSTLNRQLQIMETHTSLLMDIKNGVRSPLTQPISLYNTGRKLIPVATPNQVSADTVTDGVIPGYTAENINNAIGRNAYRLYVINRGPGDLYIIYSSGGANTFSPNEALLQEGATEIFFNVWEMRLRSPTVNCTYEVTEYEVPLQNTNTVKAEKIEIYSTVSTVHFTGTIAFQDQETTDVTGIPYNRILGNKYFIRGVNIQSIQPLIYNLIFYSSNNPYNTAGILDTDTFLDSVELDMSAAPTYRINNLNQYKLNVSDLNVVYEDTDDTRILHLGLQNMSPVAKIAGPLGAVQLDFKMSPRV